MSLLTLRLAESYRLPDTTADWRMIRQTEKAAWSPPFIRWRKSQSRTLVRAGDRRGQSSAAEDRGER